MEENSDARRFQDKRSELMLHILGPAPPTSGPALSNEAGSRREEASATIETEGSVLISGMLKTIELLTLSFPPLFSSLLAPSLQIP